MLIPKLAFSETVTIERYVGTGGIGAIYDDPRDWRARISYENKLVRDALGEEVVSSSQVMLPAAAHEHVNIGSRIQLPLAGSRRIVSGGPVYGLRGISHLQYDVQ